MGLHHRSALAEGEVIGSAVAAVTILSITELAEQHVAVRAAVLATAYAAHPERFPAGLPHLAARPVEV